jgi:hypothetical protein
LFLCSSVNDLENRLLSNNLIVIRNQGVDHGGHVGHQEGVGEARRHAHQSNSELQSLTSSLTRSLGPSYLQIDVQDVYDL